MRLIDTEVTQFELRTEPTRRVPRPASDMALAIAVVPRIPLSFYAYLYNQVGRAHHWTSRLLPPAQLAAEIHREGIEVHVLYADFAPAGWFELDWVRKAGETRLVHFGILPEFRRRGLSRWLLSEAIEAAFAVGRPLVTLETNTLDHPQALALYLEAGFEKVVTRTVSTRAIES